MRHIIKTESFRGLFRGNLAATYLWISYAAVQFTFYERTSQFLSNNTHFKPIASNPAALAFVSGGTAGVFATACTYPFDTCRTIFASSLRKRPISLLDYTSTIVSKQGIRGSIMQSYAGVIPAIIQIIPYMGINFALYELLVQK